MRWTPFLLAVGIAAQVVVIPQPFVDGSGLARGPIELSAYRQDFDGPCLKVEAADATVELVVDAAVNRAFCEGGIGMFLYRLDGDQASPFISLGGTLDIDNDGASNEGVEIIASDIAATTQGWIEVGTSPAMFVRMSVTITSVSGTDNAYFGWRQAGAFVDQMVLASYDAYGVFHINDASGNIEIETGNGATSSDDEADANAVWADAETIVMEVRVSTGGVFTFFQDGVAVTITQAVDTASAGDILYPVIAMENAASADTEMNIDYIIIGEVF